MDYMETDRMTQPKPPQDGDGQGAEGTVKTPSSGGATTTAASKEDCGATRVQMIALLIGLNADINKPALRTTLRVRVDIIGHARNRYVPVVKYLSHAWFQMADSFHTHRR